MSVNSPVAGLGEAALARAVTTTAGRSDRAGATRTRARTKRVPGAHRDPTATLWRTTMDELVYFLTIRTVRPWRTRVPVRA